MKAPTLRFRIEPIAQLGDGVHRIQVDCWRFTVNVSDLATVSTFDGAPFGSNTVADAGTPSFWPWRFTIGGVLLPGGAPVMLNQVVTLNLSGAATGGVLVYEYLDL